MQSAKRKRKVLTIEEKLDVCKPIARAMSYTAISKCYEIGWSTIVDIKKSQHKLEGFSKKMVDVGIKETKTMQIVNFRSWTRRCIFGLGNRGRKSCLLLGQH